MQPLSTVDANIEGMSACSRQTGHGEHWDTVEERGGVGWHRHAARIRTKSSTWTCEYTVNIAGQPDIIKMVKSRIV